MASLALILLPLLVYRLSSSKETFGALFADLDAFSEVNIL